MTNEMKRDVRDGEAFIFVNRSLTSMKILHAEYGGLVIYNLKLEKGCVSLPDFVLDDEYKHLGIELKQPTIEAWFHGIADLMRPMY